MAQINTDWGVFCGPSTEYSDKTAWVESLCQSLQTQTYQVSAEEITWLQVLITGLKWHFVVFFGALVLALLLGSVLGVMRTLPQRGWSLLATTYVELFRNIPLIIQYFFWLLVFPAFLPATFSADSNAMVSGLGYRHIANNYPWLIGIYGLGLYHAARVSEQVRAGIQAIPTGQWNAGFALGLSRGQIYRHTVLPMAFRTVWPTLTSEVMNLFKNSSIAFAVSVANFYAVTRSMIEFTSQDIVILTLSTFVYLFFTYFIKGIMLWMERRARVPGLIVGGQ